MTSKISITYIGDAEKVQTHGQVFKRNEPIPDLDPETFMAKKLSRNPRFEVKILKKSARKKKAPEPTPEVTTADFIKGEEE